MSDFAREQLLEQARREGLAEPEARVQLLPALGKAAAERRAKAACAKPWSLLAQDLRSVGRLRVSASCPADDAPALDFLLKGELSAEVLVAASALPANKPLAEADLLRERRAISSSGDALSDADAVVGLAPRSALRAGQIISKRSLAEAILVKRGERVRITARNGGIEVEAAGEALEAGARNAVIRVRNSNTGRIVNATVSAAGEVEIVLHQRAP